MLATFIIALDRTISVVYICLAERMACVSAKALSVLDI